MISLEEVAVKLDEAAAALEQVPAILRPRPVTIFGPDVSPEKLRAEAKRIRSVAGDLEEVRP